MNEIIRNSQFAINLFNCKLQVELKEFPTCKPQWQIAKVRSRFVFVRRGVPLRIANYELGIA